VGQLITVHRDNVVTRVRVRAHLHGRNETLRAVRAVLAALAAVAPADAFRALTSRLPAELIPAAAGSVAASNSREFIAGVAAALYTDDPSAAFLTRVVFEELNRGFPATGPARMSAALPRDLRPLLTARAEPDTRHRQTLSAWGVAAPPLRVPETATRKVRAPVQPSAHDQGAATPVRSRRETDEPVPGREVRAPAPPATRKAASR
jgi:uncharacterized protein (DUF2267 family)